MNKAQKKKSLGRQLLTGAAIALLLFASCVAYFYFISRHIAEESGQRALLAQLRSDLAEYHEQHGVFPTELSAVPVSKFSDGSSPATLQQFSYTSDGSSFTLSCIGASTHKLVTVTSDEIAAD
ncbi:MAG: hypothetical protein JWO81_3483 [Alphaproteobacteria bacterium]|nr:hypothetical protein [Alphaproteobacteria bacterium]